MHDLTVSDIHGNVADAVVTASFVEQKVARLDIIQGYACTALGLLSCRTVHADTVVCKYGLCKSGTVSTVGKGSTAPYIRIADEL